ncbi:MAG: hypothetical protein K6G18_04660 [Treponema sp.]|nr:hypothetical protein [Treponema sp.]
MENNAQILIECGPAWFGFSKSRTGQLDYVGKLAGPAPDVDGWQHLSGSAYFSPSFYTYLSDGLNTTVRLHVADGVDVSDADCYGYLLHVGALLAAVDAKDSLLAGSLYLRRRSTFEKFSQLSQFIMEPLCVEILFSLCYGRMQDASPSDIPLVFNMARDKLGFDPSRESLEQAFMRWFKDNPCTTLTLPLVGTRYHDWDCEPEVLDRLCDNLSVDDLVGHAAKIRRAKHDFYASLETTVQAEPYNPHDRNAIIVCIEDIRSKISGNPGVVKAGYIRALAAKVLRESRPKKMAYTSRLARIGGGEIVVQLDM